MANNSTYKELPLVYSCSGCSSAAQMTNALAVLLDRQKLAEMSCISGVGGDVRSLVKAARSKRPKIVLDGCPLHCAKNCLKRHDVEPDLHIDLSKEGVRKVLHDDPDFEEVEKIWKSVIIPRVTPFLE